MCAQDEAEHLKPLFDKYVESTLSFKRSSCKELIPISELNGVVSLCRLYHALATPTNGVRLLPQLPSEDQEQLEHQWLNEVACAGGPGEAT